MQKQIDFFDRHLAHNAMNQPKTYNVKVLLHGPLHIENMVLESMSSFLPLFFPIHKVCTVLSRKRILYYYISSRTHTHTYLFIYNNINIRNKWNARSLHEIEKSKFNSKFQLPIIESNIVRYDYSSIPIVFPYNIKKSLWTLFSHCEIEILHQFLFQFY